MSKEVFCVLNFFCLLSVIAASAFDNNAWFTYVDRVESVRDKRAINQPATQSPLDVTTPHNETEFVYDNHDYYEVQYKDNEDIHWLDITNLGSQLTINEKLSSSKRHAVRVQLNFTYPFYGYDTNFLHITSSGFLYVGSYSHRYLAATQYVAPLMADFDPSLDVGSTISYYGDKSMFVAEWKNLRLQEDPSGQKFTFQAAIYKNGTTVFSYKEKPISISAISSEDHPVKVGLADAYYHDTWIIEPIVSRRVIYEYHSVDVPFSKVDNFSTIIFKPLATCTGKMTCDTCTQSPPPGFQCVWCKSLNSCSDGFDRYRQAWLRHQCDKKNETTCPANMNPGNKGKPTVPTTAILPSTPVKMVHTDDYEDLCLTLDCGPGTCESNKCVCPESYFGQQCQTRKDIGNETSPQRGTSHAPLVVFFLLLIIVVVIVISWVFYAYRNPNTASGLQLIRVTRCYCLQRSGGSAPSYKYEKTGAVSI